MVDLGAVKTAKQATDMCRHQDWTTLLHVIRQHGQIAVVSQRKSETINLSVLPSLVNKPLVVDHINV